MGTSIFREWAGRRPWWLPTTAENPQVLLASKVTLVRNLRGLRFPPFAGDAAAAERACYLVKELLAQSEVLADTLELEPQAMPQDQRLFLVERGLLRSRYVHSAANSLAFVALDERRSFVINDSDHLRVNVMADGLALPALLETATSLAARLSQHAEFSRDREFGYISARVGELGSGMLFSVLMHLPAMRMHGYMPAAAHAAEAMGIVLRPLYEKRGEPAAALYQLRNLHTLAWSEKVAAERVQQFATRLCWHENNARGMLLCNNSLKLCDSVGRARGILKGAFTLAAAETAELLSRLWLGAECGLLKHNRDGSRIGDVLALVGDSSLKYLLKKNTATRELGALRARWLKRILDWE
jgi:protein arginine kinase